MTSPTDPRRFLYRADALDPALAQSLAREALARADDRDLYRQYRSTESFGLAARRVKTAEPFTDAGSGLGARAGEVDGRHETTASGQSRGSEGRNLVCVAC